MGPKKASTSAPAARGKSSSPTRNPSPKKGGGDAKSVGSSKTTKSSTSSGGATKKGGTSSKAAPKDKAGGAKKGTGKADSKKAGAADPKGGKGGKGAEKDADAKKAAGKDGKEKKEEGQKEDKDEAGGAAKKEGEEKEGIAKKEEAGGDGKAAKAGIPSGSDKPLDPNEGPTVITGKIFMQAVSDSDTRAIRTYLLARGPLPDDVLNYKNNSQMTPLMMATQKKTDFEACAILKILLSTLIPIIGGKKKKDTDVVIPEGQCNPLSGHPGVPAGTLDLNLQNRDGYTAMHFAARKGFAESLLQLIDLGADYEVVSTGAEKVTAAELTADKKCREYLVKAETLKAERERMKAVATQGIACYTSVLKGDKRGVVRVQEKQAPPETYLFRPTGTDHYMLRHAIDLGHLEILLLLLNADAEKDVWDSRGRTVLMHLCAMTRAGSYPTTKFSREKEKLRQDMLEAVLHVGTTSNAFLERRDKDGSTALIIAAENGYIEDLTQLIDKGCDVEARQISEYPYRGLPNQRTASGDTAFIITARRRQGFFECLPIGTSLVGNYMEVLQCLRYEGKAEVNTRGSNGMTALMWAVHHEDLEMLEWLIDEGADINEQENFGQTALMLAVEGLKFRSATYLLNWDLEEHIARKELEAAEMADSLAREEEEREARRKQKKKLLKLGASADPAAIAALDAKEKKSASKKAPPSRDNLLTKMKERKKKNAAKYDSKVITRWPRMLGYYKEQNPKDYENIMLPVEEGEYDDPDRPPKPFEECNPNIPALNDATPLIALSRKCLAANKAQLEPLVALIIKKGGKVNVKSSDGMSAMMWAVLNNDLALAKQLLYANADPTITDSLGISLMDNAKSGAMRMTLKAAVDAHVTSQKEEAANKEEV